MTDSVGGSGADGTEEEGEEEEPWVGHYLPLPDEKDRPSNQVSRSPVANPPPPHTPHPARAASPQDHSTPNKGPFPPLRPPRPFRCACPAPPVEPCSILGLLTGICR